MLILGHGQCCLKNPYLRKAWYSAHLSRDDNLQKQCLRWGNSPYSKEDIEEFHAEDAELIARLELLVPEFEDAYAASEDPSFYNFYNEYWTSRMNEVMADMSLVTEDYMSGVEQLGVRLRPLGPEPPPGIETTDWDAWSSNEEEDLLSGSEEE
jgi:hypothetical protein